MIVTFVIFEKSPGTVDIRAHCPEGTARIHTAGEIRAYEALMSAAQLFVMQRDPAMAKAWPEGNRVGRPSCSCGGGE